MSWVQLEKIWIIYWFFVWFSSTEIPLPATPPNKVIITEPKESKFDYRLFYKQKKMRKTQEKYQSRGWMGGKWWKRFSWMQSNETHKFQTIFHSTIRLSGIRSLLFIRIENILWYIFMHGYMKIHLKYNENIVFHFPHIESFSSLNNHWIALEFEILMLSLLKFNVTHEINAS